MNSKPTYEELENLILELKKQHKQELSKVEEKYKNEITNYKEELLKNKQITNISEKAAKMGSWYFDVKNNAFIASDNMCRIHGIDPIEFDNSLEMLRKYLHTEDIKKVVEKTEKVLTEQNPLDFEYRIILPDGSLRHISGTNKLIYDKNNKLIAVIGMNLDITEQKDNETLLNKSEKHFQILFDNITDTVFYQNAKNGKIISVNETAKQIYGYTEEEFRNLELQNFDALRNGIQIKRGLEILKTQKVLDFEAELITKNGQKIPVEIRSKMIDDNTYLSVARDISIQKQAQQKINSERNQFLSLLNTIPEPIYVSDAITNEILFANDAKKNIYGNNIVGKICYKAFYGLDSPCEFCPKLERLKSEKKAIRWIKDEKENQKTFLNIEKIIKWQDNQNARFQIAFDISELKKAEDKIRKLSVAVEQNPSTIVITDVNSNIEYVNPKFTELTGYEPEDVIGKNTRILNSGKTDTDVFSDLWEKISNGKTWSGEFINKKKNGEEFIEYATIAPIFDEDGILTNYIAIKEDITVKKQLQNTLIENEKKLRQLNATKDKFFSIIAHDLRSPFNAILGFSNLLLQKHAEYDKEKREQLIMPIVDSAERTFELLENLLQWAKTQSKRITYNPEEHDAKTVVFETIFNITNIAKSKNIKLIESIPNELTIFVDMEMIKTVLRNLITNSIKFTEEGGSINVDTEQNSNEIIFSVTDTGVGMSQDKVNKLFDITEKTNTLGTNNETGTGLGLILCKEFVEKHGGKIWVESKLGEGSSFKFTLPKQK